VLTTILRIKLVHTGIFAALGVFNRIPYDWLRLG
jgi:hypothetical protein